MDERDSLMLMRMRRKLMMIKFFSYFQVLEYKLHNCDYFTMVFTSFSFNSSASEQTQHAVIEPLFPFFSLHSTRGFLPNRTREWIELEIATLPLIVSWWLLKCWLPDESWIGMRKERFDYNLRYNWMKQEEMKLVGKRKEVVESSHRSSLSPSAMLCSHYKSSDMVCLVLLTVHRETQSWLLPFLFLLLLFQQSEK